MTTQSVVFAGNRDELRRILASARRFAWRLPAQIHVLEVIDRDVLDADLDELERRLCEGDLRVASISAHVRSGAVVRETLRIAAEVEADLVVVWGGSPDSLGQARRIVRSAACSVLVVEPNREAHESDGLIPAWPRCSACDRIRQSSEGVRWFCKSHVDPAERRHARLSFSSQRDGHRRASATRPKARARD